MNPYLPRRVAKSEADSIVGFNTTLNTYSGRHVISVKALVEHKLPDGEIVKANQEITLGVGTNWHEALFATETQLVGRWMKKQGLKLQKTDGASPDQSTYAFATEDEKLVSPEVGSMRQLFLWWRANRSTFGKDENKPSA